MYRKTLLFISMFFCLSCIGVDVTDDYVEPSIRITSPQIISIKVGQQFQFSAKYFDASGSLVEEPNFEWDVIPEDAMSINNNGLAIAEKSAEATLSVHVETTLGNVISDSTSFSILTLISMIQQTKPILQQQQQMCHQLQQKLLQQLLIMIQLF